MPDFSSRSRIVSASHVKVTSATAAGAGQAVVDQGFVVAVIGTWQLRAGLARSWWDWGRASGAWRRDESLCFTTYFTTYTPLGTALQFKLQPDCAPLLLVLKWIITMLLLLTRGGGIKEPHLLFSKVVPSASVMARWSKSHVEWDWM